MEGPTSPKKSTPPLPPRIERLTSVPPNNQTPKSPKVRTKPYLEFASPLCAWSYEKLSRCHGVIAYCSLVAEPIVDNARVSHHGGPKRQVYRWAIGTGPYYGVTNYASNVAIFRGSRLQPALGGHILILFTQARLCGGHYEMMDGLFCCRESDLLIRFSSYLVPIQVSLVLP